MQPKTPTWVFKAGVEWWAWPWHIASSNSLALHSVWFLLVFPVSLDPAVLLPLFSVENSLFFLVHTTFFFEGLRASLLHSWYSLLSLVLFSLFSSSFSHRFRAGRLPPQPPTPSNQGEQNFFWLIFHGNEFGVLPTFPDFILLPYRDKIEALTTLSPLHFAFHCGSCYTVQ